MEDIKVGSIVGLKGGSPDMTVTMKVSNIEDPDVAYWTCVWFDFAQTMYGTFPEAALSLRFIKLKE
jgi:uncharacterized protein YodC (DUF2158 family)